MSQDLTKQAAIAEADAPLSAEKETDFELPVEGFRGTPEEIERQWLEKVYRGRGDSMKQLTWRAILMGSVLGGLLSLTNIYIGLKAGWAFGVAITACILSYAIWSGLHGIGLVRTKMSILENNCMQSTASSAGYSTGGTLISAFAAYIMLNGHGLSLPITLTWIFFLAVLGVTMAVPMKRQMINIDQLRFPSGVAAAETLRALHSHGEKGMRAAKALGVAGVIAAVDNFWSGGLDVVDKYFAHPLAWLFGHSVSLAAFSSGELIKKVQMKLLGSDAFTTWNIRTVVFSWDPIFLAAGAITGMRVSLSMFISGTLCWAVYVPIFQHQGMITGTKFRDLVATTLWGGTSCMVMSGLLSFAMQWKTALRAFRSLGSMFSGKKRELSDMEQIETPISWFVTGQIVSLIALSILAHASFGMAYWQSALAVVLSFALALVACRVTGETDTTPIGALGKVTQITFGALNPGNVNVNLMSANITSSAAASSADLLTDLKSGYLLGANPRKQFIAQFAGIFTGTIVTVLAFSVIVRGPADLGTDKFPAPAAQVWAGVAKALSHGFHDLGALKVWSIIVGGSVGLALTVLPMAFPKQQKYFPVASAVGLAWVFQWYYGLLFFLGALITWAIKAWSPKAAEEFTFPVASGVIAGGSLMGVLLIFCDSGPEIVKMIVHALHLH